MNERQSSPTFTDRSRSFLVASILITMHLTPCPFLKCFVRDLQGVSAEQHCAHLNTSTSSLISRTKIRPLMEGLTCTHKASSVISCTQALTTWPLWRFFQSWLKCFPVLLLSTEGRRETSTERLSVRLIATNTN